MPLTLQIGYCKVRRIFAVPLGKSRPPCSGVSDYIDKLGLCRLICIDNNHLRLNKIMLVYMLRAAEIDKLNNKDSNYHGNNRKSRYNHISPNSTRHFIHLVSPIISVYSDSYRLISIANKEQNCSSGCYFSGFDGQIGLPGQPLIGYNFQMDVTGSIKEKAIEIGFDIVGITDAGPISKADEQAYRNWLDAGLAGEMGYMHRNFQKRIEPAKLLKGAKSVICVALNIKRADQTTGTVANFARYEDYHQFMKKQLFSLADFIASVADDKYRFKICVDSAPAAERALAVQAGLGFIGRNHMLTHPELGPEILLGEIITDLNLQTDKPIPGSCGNCNKCITACPTGALREDGQLDARKCISYLTTEYKGQIPKELTEKIGDRIFGCDQCVRACPLQSKAPACANTDFKYFAEMANLDLQEILNMNEAQFKEKFTGLTIERLGLERLQRNVKVCVENKKN